MSVAKEVNLGGGEDKFRRHLPLMRVSPRNDKGLLLKSGAKVLQNLQVHTQLNNFIKNSFAVLILYIPLHFQTSLSGWHPQNAIDKMSIFFEKNAQLFAYVQFL